MSVTVFLDTPVDDEDRIECTEAKTMGDVVWATPEGDGRQLVIPLSNVTGITGDTVDQTIDEVEYRGGRVTELVTRLS